MIKFFRILTPLVFLGIAVGIGKLVLFPQNGVSGASEVGESRFARIMTPAQRVVDEEPQAEATIVPLDQDETLVRVMAYDFDPELPGEEQLLVSRKNAQKDNLLSVTYLANGARLWTVTTPITRPWTVAMDSKDVLGNHEPCVLISGMNDAEAYILVVLRKNSEKADEAFSVIAEIVSKGSIAVQETARTQAYQRGSAQAASFPLVAFSADEQAKNPLDQIETIYNYTPELARYEPSATVHIPADQMQERSLQDVMNGGTPSFEHFVQGLWYFVTSAGVDVQQYIYFDPLNRELVFCGGDVQQIFLWQRSSSTRSKLSIAAQNISVTTLRRYVDVELDSANRIQVLVAEDVKLKISSDVVWNGSYQKAELPHSGAQVLQGVVPYITAEYSGSIGNLSFDTQGSYELASEGINRTGKYAFFWLNGEEILEFRPETINNIPTSGMRETYLITHSEKIEGSETWRDITLLPIRIGVQGIQRLRETPISLTERSTIVEERLVEAEEVLVPMEDPKPLLNFRSRPEYFSPDNDGVDDELTMFLEIQATSNPIVSWSFTIREPQSTASFYHIEGAGRPPQRVAWNGRSNQGELVQAATDYPFTFMVEDSNGNVGTLNGLIGIDVLIAREGNSLRIQVPSIIFRGDNADFVGLGKDITDNNYRVIRRISEILAKFREYRVQVEGHANRNSLSYDEEEMVELSEQRARAVVNMLVEFGIARNRLTAIGMGAKKPIAAFGDVDNYWKNRRVEFLLIK